MASSGVKALLGTRFLVSEKDVGAKILSSATHAKELLEKWQVSLSQNKSVLEDSCVIGRRTKALFGQESYSKAKARL